MPISIRTKKHGKGICNKYKCIKAIIIITLILFANISFAQKKGDNTIVVNRKVLYQELKQILFDNGYSVANSDSIFVVTESKQINKSAAIIKIQFHITDSSVVCKANSKAAVELFETIHQDFAEVYFGGMKGSVMRDSWNELNRISQLIGKNITYTKF